MSLKTLLGEYNIALEWRKETKVAFEKLIEERLGHSRDLTMIDDNHYSDVTVNFMWLAWKEGMEFLNEELKDIIGYYI